MSSSFSPRCYDVTRERSGLILTTVTAPPGTPSKYHATVTPSYRPRREPNPNSKLITPFWALSGARSQINGENNASTTISYLVFGNINGLIKDDPDCGLPASRMRRGALVSHEALCVWQQTPQG